MEADAKGKADVSTADTIRFRSLRRNIEIQLSNGQSVIVNPMKRVGLSLVCSKTLVNTYLQNLTPPNRRTSLFRSLRLLGAKAVISRPG